MINDKITFFTCCNNLYKQYIIIFIHSILYHNPNSDIEICVDNYPQDENFNTAIQYISEKYDSKIKIRIIDDFYKIKINDTFFTICPNVLRFIETPELVNKYVYICDVDIITLDKNILNSHIQNMKNFNIKYSNIVRTSDLKKLTGLHFSEWNSYYPIPEFEDLAKDNLLSFDENFLYKLVSKKNKISKSANFRPVHGIHISPNRNIDDWIQSSYWCEAWINYRNSDEFIFLEKLFSTNIKNIIENIDLKFSKIKIK